MPTTQKSLSPAESAPAQRREEIISILGDGLARLIQPTQGPSATPTAPSANMPSKKLSESVEIGLELCRETSLTVAAGQRPANG